LSFISEGKIKTNQISLIDLIGLGILVPTKLELSIKQDEVQAIVPVILFILGAGNPSAQRRSIQLPWYRF
jgi:hypothetical protein